MVKLVFLDMDDEEDDGTDENYIGFSGTKFKWVWNTGLHLFPVLQVIAQLSFLF